MKRLAILVLTVFLMLALTSCDETVKPCTEHDFVETVTKAATCVAPGEKTLTCKVCGHEEKQEIKPTRLHDYQESVKVAPTCGSKGTMLHQCKSCSDSYETEINATGIHDYQSSVKVAPTCNRVLSFTSARTAVIHTRARLRQLSHMRRSLSRTSCTRPTAQTACTDTSARTATITAW